MILYSCNKIGIPRSAFENKIKKRWKTMFAIMSKLVITPLFYVVYQSYILWIQKFWIFYHHYFDIIFEMILNNLKYLFFIIPFRFFFLNAFHNIILKLLVFEEFSPPLILAFKGKVNITELCQLYFIKPNTSYVLHFPIESVMSVERVELL